MVPNADKRKTMRKALFTLIVTLSASVSSAAPPNIVIILSDDQGYADISFNPDHPKEVLTPHMDALAKEGVFFTQAYTSGHVCSPTRAGLMLGRYQQRVNVYTAGDGGRGFDPKLPIFPAFLPDVYRSGVFGKWHLGLDTDYPELKWHAMNRGFDECYKFMGRGGHDYFSLKGVKNDEYMPIYRNKARLKENEYEGYLTTRLTEEAVDFIGRNKNAPFFLYLAYNAVHAPAQAPEVDVARYKRQFPNLSEKRTILMAMLYHLDNGVGAVVQKLKDEELWENTLLFFLTDNGGAKAMEANNGILNGYKGSLYEGGIRTPWVISWPKVFKGGRTIDTPVISLDILPTVLDALNARTQNPFDGKSILPLVTGASKTHHETLYWNSGPPRGEWAVRQGDWKAHGDLKKLELFDLAKDPSEKNNLVAKHPEKAEYLHQLHDSWLKEMEASVGMSRYAEKSTKSKAKKKSKKDNRDKEKRLSKEERKKRREARKARNAGEE